MEKVVFLMICMGKWWTVDGVGQGRGVHLTTTVRPRTPLVACHGAQRSVRLHGRWHCCEREQAQGDFPGEAAKVFAQEPRRKPKPGVGGGSFLAPEFGGSERELLHGGPSTSDWRRSYCCDGDGFYMFRGGLVPDRLQGRPAAELHRSLPLGQAGLAKAEYSKRWCVSFPLGSPPSFCTVFFSCFISSLVPKC